MYRIAVLKRGLNKLHSVMTDTLKGQCFSTEMLPLGEGISADYFVNSPVDLLLIDLCQKPKTGLRLLRELRIAGVNTEVVAYIARDDCDTLRAVCRLGVMDCLVDPFDTDRFLQAVERFLYRAQVFDKQELAQEHIDSLKQAACGAQELPKGLQKKTLNTIRAVMGSCPNTCFSCEDVVGSVKLSRITVQRYLSYLREAGELTHAVDNSTGGRPCSLYRYNPGVFA
ncbi:MAG: hypothetical protein RR389_01530 [Christensenella sp.]